MDTFWRLMRLGRIVMIMRSALFSLISLVVAIVVGSSYGVCCPDVFRGGLRGVTGRCRTKLCANKHTQDCMEGGDQNAEPGMEGEDGLYPGLVGEYPGDLPLPGICGV